MHLHGLSVPTLNKAALCYPQLLRTICSSISHLNELAGDGGPHVLVWNTHTDHTKFLNLLLSRLIISSLVRSLGKFKTRNKWVLCSRAYSHSQDIEFMELQQCYASQWCCLMWVVLRRKTEIAYSFTTPAKHLRLCSLHKSVSGYIQLSNIFAGTDDLFQVVCPTFFSIKIEKGIHIS